MCVFIYVSMYVFLDVSMDPRDLTVLSSYMPFFLSIPHVFSCNPRFRIGEWARRLKAQHSPNVSSTLNSLHRISKERTALHALADDICNTTTERFNVYEKSWAQ